MYLKENKKNARLLIVNADDFGLTKGVNIGVIKSFKEGVVTSASLLSVGKYFDHATELAKENLELDIGIHLCLTEEKPVLEKNDIPSLVDKSGCFLKSRWNFIFYYVFGKIKYAEVEKELDAQIRKISEKGLRITHIDSHGYVHMLPGVLDVAIKLAKRYNIKIIRYPSEKISFYNFKWHRCVEFCLLDLLCLLAKLNPRCRDFIKTDYFFGFMDSGQLHERAIKKTLTVFKRGIAALISDSVRKNIEESKIELAGFRDII
jgi:hypothetical protein